MNFKPQTITLHEIAGIISKRFKSKEEIVCYVGSNAATPTASLEALTRSVKIENLRLPFLKMIHLLLQGPVPYVEAGLQDRMMTYSIFSAGEVRQAANEGRAYYLPCTLANLDSLVGKDRTYEPDVVFIKLRQNEFTGEYILGLTVEALHTAIDQAELVIAELDDSMPFTQGQSVVDAKSIDYIIEADVKPVYDFVHMRTGVQMRPSSYTNSAETVRKNSPFISVNTAIGVDLFGNVWADFIDPRRYYSGVGGQPDFIRALSDRAFGTPIIAMKSITRKGDSKIVELHPPGISLTTSAYDGVVIVTEYGIADLRGLTSGEKAQAIASIAHPKFREEFLRLIYEDPLFTKTVGFYLDDRLPRGVSMYRGSIDI